jgi:hypothetical protein
MDIYESNCLVVDWDILRKVFGEKYWNDRENIICVPTNRITEEEFDELLDFDLEKIAIKEEQFLIAEL